MLIERILRGGLLVCLMLPVGLFSQTPSPAKGKPAPTGLKILSTTLEAPTALNPELRPVRVTVQNVTTDKTVVARAFVIHEFDKDGREINPHGAGIAIDYAKPDASPSDTRNFIPPGQVRSIPVYSANLAAVSVTVTLTGLVYEDCSSEGDATGVFFASRRDHAREARGQAAQETGEKKAPLEKRADWYEAYAVEAER